MSVQSYDRKLTCSSLKRNIQLLERASGCFTCSMCSQNKGLNDGHLNYLSNVSHKPDSSTSDPEVFVSHLTKYHSNTENHLCLYCDSIVHRNYLMIHISQHLLTPSSSKSPRIFSCPSKPQCSHEFSTDRFQHMQIHWDTQHNSSSETPKLQCSQCMNTFSTLLEWGEHIKLNLCSLVHCTFPGCFVKSPSRTLILDHFRRKHTDFLDLKEETSSQLFRETSEVGFFSISMEYILHNNVLNVCRSHTIFMFVGFAIWKRSVSRYVEARTYVNRFKLLYSY